MIAGERRWLACKLLGMTEIEATVWDGNLTDDFRLVIAAVENLQREDMSILDEAKIYAQLVGIGWSYNEIARKVSHTSATIQSRLRILDYPESIQEEMNGGYFPHDPRVLDALNRIQDVDLQVRFVENATKKGLTIKQTVAAIEHLIKANPEVLKKVESNPAPSASMTRQTRREERNPDLKAVRIVQEKKNRDSHRWNALVQVGKVPAWELVVSSSNAVCEKCSLGSIASDKVCKDCPLPIMLGDLIDRVNRSA